MKKHAEAQHLGGKCIARNNINKIKGVRAHLGKLGTLCFRVYVFKTLNIEACISDHKST